MEIGALLDSFGHLSIKDIQLLISSLLHVNEILLLLEAERRYNPQRQTKMKTIMLPSACGISAI